MKKDIPPLDAKLMADGSSSPGTVVSPKNRFASGRGSTRRSSESRSGVVREELAPDPGCSGTRS